MDTRNILSISEARKKIFDITKKVQKQSTHFTLTDNGKPRAVIMSSEEFDSWVETLEVAHLFPSLKKDIAQSEKEYAKGDYVTFDQLRLQTQVTPKRRSHAVSHSPAKKRTKGPSKS